MSAAGRQLPPTHAPIPDDTVDFAIELLEVSGVAEMAEAAAAKPTGRPRSVPITALLVGLVILAVDDRALHLTAVTELLYCRISDASRQRLGLKGVVADRKSFEARYRCVRYSFHALCGAMDPSPLPKNRRLAPDELAQKTAETTAPYGRPHERLGSGCGVIANLTRRDADAVPPGAELDIEGPITTSTSSTSSR